jgi:hypothetical protein
MLKVKVVVVAVFAVAALSAIAAGSASAGWFVGGAELKSGSAAIATTAAVDGDFRLLMPVQKVTILCTATVLQGTAPRIIGGTNKGFAQSLIFEGCATTEPASGCSLEESTVPTEPVLGAVTLATAPADRVTFTPETGKLFAQIPFKEGNTCAFSGKQPVKGSVVINAPTGQTESETQAIEGLGSVENNSLEVGSGNKAFIDPTGKALLVLASKSKWSFK